MMELSDSLIVLFGGEIRAYIPDVHGISDEELGLFMLGLKRQSEEEIRRATHD